MKIITVSREFGSGGRELGKRLADALGMQYYDREILTALAEKTEMDEAYVSKKMEKGNMHHFPITFARTFSYGGGDNNTVKLLAEQQKLLKKIAEKGEDFVIIGRNADIALGEYQPLNLFVYANMESKVNRCMAREEGNLTAAEMTKRIKQVDKGRKKSRELMTERAWGRRRPITCVSIPLT